MKTEGVLWATVMMVFSATCAFAENSPEPKPPTEVNVPSVTSTGQSGGVAAGYVNQLNQIIPTLVRGPLLQNFEEDFRVGAIVLRSLQDSSITDDQIEVLCKATYDWANGTYNWLKVGVSQYAAERFLFHQPSIISWGMGGNHKDGYAQKRSGCINDLYPWLQNVDMLMREPTIYPPK